MSKNKHRNFSSDFKTKAAIEAIKEKQTLSELATKYELHPTQISDWKKSFLAGANLVFEQDSETKKEKTEDTSVLYEQIGRLQMDIAFLKKIIEKPSTVLNLMIFSHQKSSGLVQSCKRA